MRGETRMGVEPRHTSHAHVSRSVPFWLRGGGTPRTRRSGPGSVDSPAGGRVKIIVCVKRVVDTETRVKIRPDGRSLDATGVQWILAPYDEIALEKAIQLRDAAGQGSVTLLTVGPADAAKELRSGLAMGADAALHVVAEPPTD